MNVHIGAARRSPIGKLGGALSSLAAAGISAQVIANIVETYDLDPTGFDDVILGQVLTGGAGQDPARQAAIGAGISVATPALTINQVCGAGQRSIHLAAQSITAGDADLVIAGGQDSMTQAPHVISGRTPGKPGDRVARDSMIVDGLWDAFHDMHMGATVEKLASRFQITRDAQDEFALASQVKTAAATSAGKLTGEIAAITVVDKSRPTSITADEHPRSDTTRESLAALSPVFDPDGTITAGNAAGLNDGAAAVVVGSEAGLQRAGLDPLVRIAAYASAGVEPMDMGLGPIVAATRALELAGWRATDLDLLEINEAFAAQAIIVNQQMGWDPTRVNVNGGAIALGHPLAGSGCRIVVTLIHEMIRRGAHKGLAALCVGGGQGVAICLER